jgi:hypothetical protein
MTALEQLAAAIDSRSSVYPDFLSTFGYGHHFLAHNAFSGSLDAAKALHEAVLPGWDVPSLDQASNLAGSPWGCEVAWFDGANPNNNRKVYSGHSFDGNPARAWLLAIVRALIAKEKA